MGITIHYTGSVERARLNEMLDAARFYCAEQRWHALDVDERISGQIERMAEQVETAVKHRGAEGVEVESTTRLFPIDDTLSGLLVTFHPAGEPVRLTFNQAGEMVYYSALNDMGEYLEYKSLFTTTQTAGTDAHIALCEFLHWLNDMYMPDLHVYDEGGYYESGDVRALAGAFYAPYAEAEQPRASFENVDQDNRQGIPDLAGDETDGQAAPRALQDRRTKKLQHPTRGRNSSAAAAPTKTDRST